MDDLGYGMIIGAAMVAVIWLITMFFVIDKFTERQQELIEKGIGQYNSQTSEFQILSKQEIIEEYKENDNANR